MDTDTADEVRKNFAEHLRDQGADDPTTATDEQLVAAGTARCLEGLARYGVVDLVPRKHAKGKAISARLDHVWKWSSESKGWEVKTRYVAREYKWMEKRDDLFTPGATQHEGRIVDFIALREDQPTFTLDAEDAYYHVNEPEDVWVEALASVVSGE